MTEWLVSIVVAVIGGLFSLLGVIITVNHSVKKSNEDLLKKIQHQSELNDVKLDAKLEKHQAVTDTKIDELTREVRKHNNFAERIPALEARVEALQESLSH